MKTAPSATTDPFVSALSERFETDIDLFQGYSAIHFADGRQLNITFDDMGATLIVPLPRAHDGLPASILIGLLKQNFAGHGAAGMTLRCCDGMDHLEIAGSISYATTTATAFADIADALVRSATAIDAWLEQECRAVLMSDI